MKKVFLALFAGLLAISSFAQQKKVDEVIKFNEAAHNFGKIPQGKPVTYDFVFTNISKEPIVIERAQASCGCTTPKWPQEAIMPGKSGVINVGYNAAAVSPFDKSITVKIAGIDEQTSIKINGEVVAANAATPEKPATVVEEKKPAEVKPAATTQKVTAPAKSKAKKSTKAVKKTEATKS